MYKDAFNYPLKAGFKCNRSFGPQGSCCVTSSTLRSHECVSCSFSSFIRQKNPSFVLEYYAHVVGRKTPVESNVLNAVGMV